MRAIFDKNSYQSFHFEFHGIFYTNVLTEKKLHAIFDRMFLEFLLKFSLGIPWDFSYKSTAEKNEYYILKNFFWNSYKNFH